MSKTYELTVKVRVRAGNDQEAMDTAILLMDEGAIAVGYDSIVDVKEVQDEHQ